MGSFDKEIKASIAESRKQTDADVIDKQMKKDRAKGNKPAWIDDVTWAAKSEKDRQAAIQAGPPDNDMSYFTKGMK